MRASHLADRPWLKPSTCRIMRSINERYPHDRQIRCESLRSLRVVAPAGTASGVFAASTRGRVGGEFGQDALPPESVARQRLGESAELPTKRPQAGLSVCVDATRRSSAFAAD